ELMASVAWCGPAAARTPWLMIDDPRPDAAAILPVFGRVMHRRRRHGRGRRKPPALKPPPGLRVGVVHQLRDAQGCRLGIRTGAGFRRLMAIHRRIFERGSGRTIQTSSVERLNGTLRGHPARLARRTQEVSRGAGPLPWGRWVFRDLDHGVGVHGTLEGRTPA